MTPHTWFRLLVRATGLLLIGIGLPPLFQWVFMLVNGLTDPSFVELPPGERLLRIAALLPIYSCQVVMGTYLLFFADKPIRRLVRDAVRRCPACGRRHSGPATERCPACGHAQTPPIVPSAPA